MNVMDGQVQEEVETKDIDMKRIPITLEAYEAAMQLGRMMRRELGGYKPDVSLVISALTVDGLKRMQESKEVIGEYARALFTAAHNTRVDNPSPAGTSTEPPACPMWRFSG